MKKALALILAIAMVFALAACGQTSAPANEETSTAGTTNTVSEKPTKVYRWRFQSTENESIAMYRARNELCQKIAEETNGGLIITQYAGGAIISDMNIPDAVSTGTIEMGNVYLNPLYASVPTSNMVGILPGFMFNVAECMMFMQSYGALEIFQKECEEILNCVCYPELTGRALYLSTKPITEIKDFKGLQIKAYGPLGSVLTKLGASCVSLNSSEIYTSLQTGLCDAANWGAYEGAVGASLQEVCNYIIEPAFGIGIGTVNMINKDAYDSLPAEYQAVLDKYFSQRITESVLITDEGEYNAKQLMLDAGLEVCTLSDEAKATMQELALKEIEKLSETNDACGQIYEQLLLYLKYNNEFAWN